MFEKLVAIEPVSLIPSAEEELHRYAKEVVLYRDVPGSDAEMVRRIGDADAVLLSYTSRMGKEVIAQCPNIRYIGMCCSLYSEESANVDIAYARTRGIQVLGIRDYGDRGVVEYVLHELTGILHGFRMPMLRDEPVEITGLKVGIVGLGVSGRMIADALQFMGAEISYFARSAKPDAEAAGMAFKPLSQLLAESEVVFTCLNKNVLLLGKDEFAQLGAGKVLFNTLLFFATALGVGLVVHYAMKWLDQRNPHTQRITIVSMAFCFAMAYIAEEYFGIADITGAYIAGIVLCTMDDAPYVERRVDISNYVIFAPIFFASIGLKTDISGLTPEILLFCVCFVIVALITKIIGCGLAAKICRFSWGDSLKVGVGMMTRGEVALIVAQKGLAVGVVDPVYFTAVILLIVVSSVATPLVLKALFAKQPPVPHPSQAK